MDEALCKSYREAVDLKIKNLETKVDKNKELADVRHAGNEKAVKLAEETLRDRMARDNEIREELRHQSETFLSRREFYIILTLIIAIVTVVLFFLKQ